MLTPMPITIRSRLLLLVLSVLLPAVAAAGWLIARTYAAEREAQERNLRDTARALSMVVGLFAFTKLPPTPAVIVQVPVPIAAVLPVSVVLEAHTAVGPV